MPDDKPLTHAVFDDVLRDAMARTKIEDLRTPIHLGVRLRLTYEIQVFLLIVRSYSLTVDYSEAIVFNKCDASESVVISSSLNDSINSVRPCTRNCRPL